MLYPPVADLLKNVESRYLLVNVVAQRARQIAAEAEAFKEELPEQPVTLNTEPSSFCVIMIAARSLTDGPNILSPVVPFTLYAAIAEILMGLEPVTNINGARECCT